MWVMSAKWKESTSYKLRFGTFSFDRKVLSTIRPHATPHKQNVKMLLSSARAGDLHLAYPLPSSHIILNTRIIVFFTLFIFMLAARCLITNVETKFSTFHISLFRQDMGEIESFQETIHDSTISDINFCFGKLILQHWIQKMKV